MQFDGLAFPDGSAYVPTRAWYDLYNSINNAKKFIYITGWSIYTETQLLRGTDDPGGFFSRIGDLLNRKADSGVMVVVVVWDDKTSNAFMEGKMATHDEQTKAFFEGTNVTCIGMERRHIDGVMSDTLSSIAYSHHQKTVICDSKDECTGLSRVIAFIGGLDITDGRYDTPEFSLYKTINNIHKGDFYSNCVVGATAKTGPRQPWHDCHAKVEGTAAIDIMKNFEKRWYKQANDNLVTKGLYSLNKDEFLLDSDVHIPFHEGGLWNLQLFRSISSDSCFFDYDLMACLHSKGGRQVDNSIMRCMVQQIRNAQNFIYIENQYFLGSAYSWEQDSGTLSHHTIPMEITQRIIDKIYVGESFKVYVLIPMFPEGDPCSIPSQEILYWQYRTIQAMYRLIGSAINVMNSASKPTDYLMFFCLGKRESPDEFPLGEFDVPDPSSQPAIIRWTLRHCVYVHSKMAIIDDDYVLIGSANINQRSLAGERDTEIAIGGYQPEHLADGIENPRGDIHTYRMALWAAHFGGFDEAFLNPNTQKCLDKVKEISQAFWVLYTAESPEHSDVHMLPYPINVDKEGNVMSLESPWDYFPDTYAMVLGCNSGLDQIQKLTT